MALVWEIIPANLGILFASVLSQPPSQSTCALPSIMVQATPPSINERRPLMALLSRPASAAYLSLVYITVGALIDVWSGIWYWYLTRNPPVQESTWYWCYGFILTGFVILVIGLAVGRIGRSARH